VSNSTPLQPIGTHPLKNSHAGMSAVLVTNNSLTGFGIQKGDRAIITETDKVLAGQIVFVAVGEKNCLRAIFPIHQTKDLILLASGNSAYPLTLHHCSEIQVIGYVEWVERPVFGFDEITVVGYEVMPLPLSTRTLVQGIHRENPYIKGLDIPDLFETYLPIFGQLFNEGEQPHPAIICSPESYINDVWTSLLCDDDRKPA
jgi:hypothetical protein